VSEPTDSAIRPTMTVESAEAMGRQAYCNGIKSAPFFDRAFMAACPWGPVPTDRANSPALSMLDAWIRGWNAECAATIARVVRVDSVEASS
jgi:hypothetical protein